MSTSCKTEVHEYSQKFRKADTGDLFLRKPWRLQDFIVEVNTIYRKENSNLNEKVFKSKDLGIENVSLGHWAYKEGLFTVSYNLLDVISFFLSLLSAW